MVKMMTCWYVAECPAKDCCTKAAFTRAQVKSIKSAQECKDYLRTHLQNSGLHQNVSQAAINILVDSAEIHSFSFDEDLATKTWTRISDEDEDEAWSPRPKRARSSQDVMIGG